MMRFAVFVCLLVAVWAAPEEGCCSHDDAENILHSWETVWSAEFVHRRIAIAKEVFKKFFELDPEVKPVFKRVNVDDIDSGEFLAHCVRVANGLDLIINLEYNPDALHEHLEHLAEQHAEYEGLTHEHFRLFREAMENVLPQAIPCFNVHAWHRCIGAAHHVMESQLTQ